MLVICLCRTSRCCFKCQIFQMWCRNIGQITPIPENGKKDLEDFQSYRPITVSWTLFKILSLQSGFLSRQFGFQKELSREYAFYALFSILANVKGFGDFLFLCALIIARAFDLCIFAQVLSETIKQGVDPSVINCLRYMYSHLKAKIKGVRVLFSLSTKTATLRVRLDKTLRNSYHVKANRG